METFQCCEEFKVLILAQICVSILFEAIDKKYMNDHIKNFIWKDKKRFHA